MAYVGEFTAFTNAILRGRNETIELESREVGDLLKSIGLLSERLGSAGRGIRLFNDIGLKFTDWLVHTTSFQLHDRTDLCEYCTQSRMVVVTE